MLQTELNKLIEYATGPEFSEEIHKAKDEYREVTGDIYEDDPSFENRMAAFLEWYTFDRFITGDTTTPLLAYIAKNKDTWPAETLEVYENFAGHILGIFIVKKVKKDHVVVLNLFNKTTHQVQETQSEIIFRKNEIFEGRIVSYSGQNYFTGAYCFHPQKTLKFIKSEIGKLNKELKKLNLELKNLQAEKNKLAHQINKLNTKINKLNSKIEKSISLLKKDHLQEKKKPLDKKKSGLESNLSELENKISDLVALKIGRETPQARLKLMQRLSYMSLKWERFRHFDLADIYRN